MAKLNETAVNESIRGRRKKIWEVGGYNCSVIGTCLKRSEVRKIATKKKFGIPADCRDHEMHSALVSLTGSRCDEARALHQLLDKKYRVVVAKFSKVKTEESVRRLWREHFERGSIASAYWALLTHPATSKEFAAEVHGEVHMLGHDFTEAYQQRKRQMHELKTKTISLEESLAEARQERDQEKQRFAEQSDELRKLRAELAALKKQNGDLENQVAAAATEQHEAAANASREAVENLQAENTRLKEEKRQLLGEMSDLRELFDLASDTAKDLEEENVLLVQEAEDLKRDLGALEAAFEAGLSGLQNQQVRCEKCNNCSEEDCPGVDLCGKTVLYVGGHHKMVPRYRELVEKYGGNFLHHDGGREVSRNVLPKILTRADAVVCPVDCVSHDACKCVKKMCKRYQKDYIMMRTSGLSSLARGLTEINVQ